MDPNAVTLGLAVLAGLASFLSPCVLALVPAYVGYLGGRSVDATGQTLFYRVGVMLSEGWGRMEHDMGLAAYSQGGASDRRIHLPVRFEGLEFGKYYCPCKQSHPPDPEKDVLCPCPAGPGGRSRRALFLSVLLQPRATGRGRQRTGTESCTDRPGGP